MEQPVCGIRPAREIAFTIRETTRDVACRGFDATIYDATAGHSDLVMAEDTVSMHLGNPAFVTSACDGQKLHRLQVPGDVKIVPSGFSRVWQIDSPTKKLVMSLEPWFLKETAEHIGVRGFAALAPSLHDDDERIRHIGWAIHAELNDGMPSGRLFIESIASALAIALVRKHSVAGPAPKSRLSRRCLERVRRFVDEEISRDLSLHELAQIAGMSVSHFKAVFREATGLPVHRYVIGARVRRASEMLVGSSAPIAHVAAATGFSSQSHLARHIRRQHGVSPAELRRRSR